MQKRGQLHPEIPYSGLRPERGTTSLQCFMANAAVEMRLGEICFDISSQLVAPARLSQFAGVAGPGAGRLWGPDPLRFGVSTH